MENKENEVKKCKHCQSDIPKKAKICPNCRKKQGGKLKFIIAWIFLIIIAIASCLERGLTKKQWKNWSFRQKNSE